MNVERLHKISCARVGLCPGESEPPFELLPLGSRRRRGETAEAGGIPHGTPLSPWGRTRPSCEPLGQNQEQLLAPIRPALGVNFQKLFLRSPRSLSRFSAPAAARGSGSVNRKRDPYIFASRSRPLAGARTPSPPLTETASVHVASESVLPRPALTSSRP